MKNEIELCSVYFDKREVPTRRELWNKIEDLQSRLEDKEKDYQQLKEKLHTSEQETLHFQNKYFAEKQLAINELEKLKENAWQLATDISCLLDYTELVRIVDNQINKLKEGK